MLSETICWKKSKLSEGKSLRFCEPSGRAQLSNGTDVNTLLGQTKFQTNLPLSSSFQCTANPLTNANHLSCLYTNATSLNNKLDELIIEIINHQASIILVSETWWSKESATNINGFNLFRSGRTIKGGGFCIYIKNNIKSYGVNDEYLNSSKIEQTWCIFEVGSEKIICGCIYRTGISTLNENLDIINSIKQVYNIYSKKNCTGILIGGDFNYASIKWYDGFHEIFSDNDEQAKDFNACLNECYLHQNVINPTFQIKFGVESNVLDLIITENDNRVISINHHPPLGGIEHGHHVISFRCKSDF